MQTEVISYRYHDKSRSWVITFDGVMLGDSRGYRTEDEVKAAALAFVAKDHADAKRYDRAPFRVFQAA